MPNFIEISQAISTSIDVEDFVDKHTQIHSDIMDENMVALLAQRQLYRNVKMYFNEQ